MTRPKNNVLIGILLLLAAAVAASIGYPLVALIIVILAVIVFLGWLS